MKPRLLILFLLFVLSGCGTLTGIPAHGGGKRFATEQRLVSASIRSALMDLDVSALQGKRVALVFDLIADEGAGSFNGGRWSPSLLLSVGSAMSPVTTTNAFQVYNLADSGTNYSNSGGGGGSTSVSTSVQSGVNDNSGSSTTGSTSSNNSTTNSTSANSGSGTSTSSNNSTTINSGNSLGTSTSTTGGTSTNTNFNQGDSSTNATIGTGTDSSSNTSSGSDSSTNASSGSGSSSTTSSGSGSSTNASSGSGSSTTSSTGSGSSTNASTSSGSSTNASTSSGSNRSESNSSSSSNNDSSSTTRGGQTSQRQTLSPSATQSTTRTEGTRREHTASIAYRGLGEYQNFPVPKSDASLLMGLVRNYLMLKGVVPTTPNDPNADVLLYMTVDIFGTVRSRFDALLYNNETVKAETSLEIMAFDRTGQLILAPQSSNREARYREHYVLWTGPVTSHEQVYPGQGLLVDFSQVSPNPNPAIPVMQRIEREHPGGKN